MARVLIIMLLFATVEACWAESAPVGYFLEQAPAAISPPVPGRDVVVARIQIVGRPIYLIGRDQSGAPPPPPKNLFFARLKIPEVQQGMAKAGDTMEVTFGAPGSSRVLHPHTPVQLAREYNVVVYLDEDNKRHLVGFPFDQKQYDLWENELREFERLRQKY